MSSPGLTGIAVLETRQGLRQKPDFAKQTNVIWPPVQPSAQVRIRQKPDDLAGLDHCDGFAEFDQSVSVDQRRQQPRALARKFDRLKRTVVRRSQGDADIFAAAALLPAGAGGSRPHRTEVL